MVEPRSERTAGGSLVPLLDVAVSPGASDLVSVDRLDANLWELSVGSGGRGAELRVELDVCGAWVTLRHDTARPVVARRAGWVDLRGHPPPNEGMLDRVGLGPGDAILVPVAPVGVEPELMAALLDRAGSPPFDLNAAAAASVRVEAVTLGVPSERDAATHEMVAAATGLPAETFLEPLHPVGSPAAELWRARPAPPREARLRVPPVPEAVTAARALLRRLMASWRMEELLDGSLEILATEIVTNAVIHAGTPVDVTVRYTGDAVLFDVFDRAPQLPTPAEPELDAERGRGLWMMTKLASAFGIEPTADGKRIWFAVDA